jgi:hypothetical protein
MCFSAYVDADTVIMSMIFNTALTVPDVESAVQIKNRVKAKVQNPYKAGALKAKIRKEARETAKTEPSHRYLNRLSAKAVLLPPSPPAYHQR